MNELILTIIHWYYLLIFFQDISGTGSPLTAQFISSLVPINMTTDPDGVSSTVGRALMTSVATMSTCPATFSALHLYCPSSDPETSLNLQTRL